MMTSGFFGGNQATESVLVLPSVKGEEAPEKTVPNCCAICLSSYKAGESVVWSASGKCSHAFHQDCVLEYLGSVKGDKILCPCCRQDFCDVPTAPTKCGEENV